MSKDIIEEPSSNFRRQRVDMLLMELTRRFPPPVIRPVSIRVMILLFDFDVTFSIL